MSSRASCPACGSGVRGIIAELPYDSPPISVHLREFYANNPGCDFAALAGATFRLADCRDCQCIYQVDLPDAAYLEHFYARGLYGTPAAQGPLDPYQVEQSVRELMMVVRFLQPRVPRPRVLDFGTGDGAWARLAAAAGTQAHACDLSTHAFPQLGRLGITCHPPGELPAATFDLINTEQVFEHLAAPLAELERLARALKPGGVLKIGVPWDAQLRTKLAAPDWLAPKNSPASLNAVAPIEHLNHFEPQSLVRLAARAGLWPLEPAGWDLTDPAGGRAARGGWRQRLGRRLRERLGATYRPHHPLTQTAFFQHA
jgi:SAM-dependent methyltransferase